MNSEKLAGILNLRNAEKATLYAWYLAHGFEELPALLGELAASQERIKELKTAIDEVQEVQREQAAGVIKMQQEEIDRLLARISDQDRIISQLTGNVEGYAMRCRQLEAENERLQAELRQAVIESHDWEGKAVVAEEKERQLQAEAAVMLHIKNQLHEAVEFSCGQEEATLQPEEETVFEITEDVCIYLDPGLPRQSCEGGVRGWRYTGE
jgi:chromosome segregation ATPase